MRVEKAGKRQSLQPSSDAAAFDPGAAGWSFQGETGFIGLVGPFWSKVDEGGRRRFGFMAEERHANLVGIVQGGMLMTFADRGLGIMAWDVAGKPSVTASFEMQFVGAGRIGSFLELEGEVLRKTASLVFMRGLVWAGRGLVASCQGSWKILSERRAGAPSRSEGDAPNS